jgi:hypothetical protein
LNFGTTSTFDLRTSARSAGFNLLSIPSLLLSVSVWSGVAQDQLDRAREPLPPLARCHLRAYDSIKLLSHSGSLGSDRIFNPLPLLGVRGGQSVRRIFESFFQWNETITPLLHHSGDGVKMIGVEFVGV